MNPGCTNPQSVFPHLLNNSLHESLEKYQEVSLFPLLIFKDSWEINVCLLILWGNNRVCARVCVYMWLILTAEAQCCPWEKCAEWTLTPLHTHTHLITSRSRLVMSHGKKIEARTGSSSGQSRHIGQSEHSTSLWRSTSDHAYLTECARRGNECK